MQVNNWNESSSIAFTLVLMSQLLDGVVSSEL